MKVMCCDGQNKRHRSTSIVMIVNHAPVDQPVCSTASKYLNSNDLWRSTWILKY